jgi:hypothetical protein
MRSFEDFVAVARAVVQREADDHADDRWWVLEPKLILERSNVRVVELARRPEALRALRGPGLAALPAAVAARRAAVALHADLSLEAEIAPAIVLAVAGTLAVAVEHARVLRTDLGTPRLGPWEPSDLEEADVASALHAALR